MFDSFLRSAPFQELVRTMVLEVLRSPEGQSSCLGLSVGSWTDRTEGALISAEQGRFPPDTGGNALFSSVGEAHATPPFCARWRDWSSWLSSGADRSSTARG